MKGGGWWKTYVNRQNEDALPKLRKAGAVSDKKDTETTNISLEKTQIQIKSTPGVCWTEHADLS